MHNYLKYFFLFALTGITLVGVNTLAGDNVNSPIVRGTDQATPTTLILVSSSRTPSGENEYLVFRSSDENTTKWKFIVAEGFTIKGINPKGKVVAEGEVAGGKKGMSQAFSRVTRLITDKNKSDHEPWPYYSLIYMDGENVETCQLWSGKQYRNLLHEGEFKETIALIKKEVFGKRYHIADLLKFNEKEQEKEPLIPEQPKGEFPSIK